MAPERGPAGGMGEPALETVFSQNKGKGEKGRLEGALSGVSANGTGPAPPVPGEVLQQHCENVSFEVPSLSQNLFPCFSLPLPYPGITALRM